MIDTGVKRLPRPGFMHPPPVLIYPASQKQLYVPCWFSHTSLKPHGFSISEHSSKSEMKSDISRHDQLPPSNLQLANQMLQLCRIVVISCESRIFMNEFGQGKYLYRTFLVFFDHVSGSFTLKPRVFQTRLRIAKILTTLDRPNSPNMPLKSTRTEKMRQPLIPISTPIPNTRNTLNTNI